MTRNQLLITAGAVIALVVAVLYGEFIWPLFVAVPVGGLIYWIFTKTKTGEKLKEGGKEKGVSWVADRFTKEALLIILFVGCIVWFVLATFSEPVTKTVLVDGAEQTKTIFSWSRLWIYAVIAYVVLSYRFWKPVPLGEQAALSVLGVPGGDVGSGPPFAPLAVVKVLTVTAQTPQREFPAEPELIDRTELKGGYVIPPNKRPPLRIQFRDSITQNQAKELFGDDYFARKRVLGEDGKRKFATDDNGVEEKGIEFVADVPTDGSSAAKAAADGLSLRVTAEVQHVARIRVESPTLFFTNVPPGDTDNPLDEAFRQIEDEMVKILLQYFTRMSVAQALMNIRWISIHLLNAVDERVGALGDRRSWGIDVQAAFVKLIHTDHGINTAISEAAQAPFEKTKIIIAAEAEEKRLEFEGRGKASAAFDLEKRTLDARAAGTKELADKIGVSGAEAQAAEVARSIGEGGNTIVVGADGFSQLAGVAAAALGKPKKKPAEDAGETTQEGDNS